MKYIAHIREKDKENQTVKEHLLGVKNLAEKYGEKIGIEHITGLAGLLHDLGKYSDEFLDYINKAVYQPELAPARGSVDHSTSGGKFMYEFLHAGSEKDIFSKLLAEIVGNVIISHHSYLHDFLSPELESPYLRRVKEKELVEYEHPKQMFFKDVMTKSDLNSYTAKALEELKEFVQQTTDENREAQLMFLTKYVFSALIDADRIDTFQFVENEQNEVEINTKKLFASYYIKLKNKLDEYAESPQANSRVNLLRASMSDQCEDFAKKKPGIYTLSIPTGGGKTLASLRYALKHAQLYNKKRIIYIVPYTTIIEQNAADVRKILGEDAFVLEHHSNAIAENYNIEEDIYSSKIMKRKMLAKDNWETPIIFTTMVQFLNVFYAYGSRNTRRLHNLAESVLIFDEVQKLPANCVSLFNQSLNFLNQFGKSSIILCTATQPALDFVKKGLNIEANAEMIENINLVIEQFKRVNIIDQVTDKQFNQESLTNFIEEKLADVRNILIILNTKSAVKDLYEELKLKYEDTIPIYHLSTSMCPSHRTFILNKIRKHLKHLERIVCVSTQLIEAGVDISFQCVIRSLAGLDSIAQAAGRCNRHGEQDKGNVYVVDYLEEKLNKLKEISLGKQIAKEMFVDLRRDCFAHGGSMLSIKAMSFYFKRFYKEKEIDLDYPIKGMNYTVTQLLMANTKENILYHEYRSRNANKSITHLVINNSYKTAARHFRVIDSPTTAVIVPYGKGKDIIKELNGELNINNFTNLLRQAQLYSVNVYPYQIDLLNDSGSLTTLLDDQIYALKEGSYDLEYGLNIKGDSKLDFLVN